MIKFDTFDKSTLIVVFTTILACLLLGNTAIATYNNKDILQDMKLNDCRIVQEQDEHIKQGNWSMFAYDIACVRWKSFEVYTPWYFNLYVIEKIDYDNRLWNYIVLRHWEFRFIYWHTITDFQVWDTFLPWKMLGKVDRSWLSENYHLHIELWKLWDNIKFEFLWGQGLFIADKSWDLRVQRWLLTDKEVNWLILDFIKDYEWLRLVAYDDWKQFSIGYGTKSKPNEKITELEAEKRARIKIQDIREQYKLYNYWINTQIAITSFVYNIWSLTSEQVEMLENNYRTKLANELRLYNKADWKVLNWLKKRRNAEYDLLVN